MCDRKIDGDLMVGEVFHVRTDIPMSLGPGKNLLWWFRTAARWRRTPARWVSALINLSHIFNGPGKAIEAHSDVYWLPEQERKEEKTGYDTRFQRNR
jgi:hypothetical protein